jgi:uncharacterized protein
MQLLEQLQAAGLILKQDDNELDILRQRINEGSKTFKITIAPTLHCNLNCFYCYQGHSSGRMDITTCNKIIDELKKIIKTKKYNSVFVDWYGGEPLLELNVIKYFSNCIFDFCLNNNIKYSSSIVTNGTLLTSRNITILKEAKITNIQITLDGDKVTHDKYRPFANGKGSFELIFDNLKLAASHFNINLRINVDNNNINSAFHLLNKFEQNNLLLNKQKKFIPYISMIGKLGENCSFSMSNAIDIFEFYDFALSFQKKVIEISSNITIDEVLELPKKNRKACGAQDADSICIDPFGNIFKCGLELHDEKRSCGKIWDSFECSVNYKKWIDFNPFSNEKCVNCIYFPICLGGCQKYSFDNNDLYRSESCEHWHNYFEKILTKYLELKTGAQNVYKIKRQ